MEDYYRVFYTFEPLPGLADWLRDRVEPEVAQQILEPSSSHSLELAESDWSDDDHLLRAKLLFLHGLLINAQWRWHTKFEAVFGTSDIGSELFDQWWTIRRIPAEQGLDWLEETFAHSSTPQLPTGSAHVDDWLTKLRTRKPLIRGSVVFHSPSELQISPSISGVWNRPILDLLVAAQASGGIGNQVQTACSGFLSWCAQTPRPERYISVSSLTGVPPPAADVDPFETYDRIMAEISNWDPPPFLVDLNDFVITQRGQILWPPEKQNEEKPKDFRIFRPDSPFPWLWFGQDLGDVRTGGDHTYGSFSFAELPPIPMPLDGTFQWLRSANSHEHLLADPKRTEDALTRLLQANPQALPGDFVEFFRSPELWNKIRSCTDCYLNLDSAFTEIHGGLGRLVRFLSDSQGCLFWCLHVSPCGTKFSVVTTYHFSGSERSHLPGGGAYRRDITAVADSFEEFLFRFWIENELWYAMNDDGPMPEFGEEYLEHYRQL